MLTIKDASARLSLSDSTIRRLIRNGSIDAVSIGRSVRIKEAEISRIENGGARSPSVNFATVPDSAKVARRRKGLRLW